MPKHAKGLACYFYDKDSTFLDRTHLSEMGADETAKLVADEIRKNIPELAKLLR